MSRLSQAISEAAWEAEADDMGCCRHGRRCRQRGIAAPKRRKSVKYRYFFAFAVPLAGTFFAAAFAPALAGALVAAFDAGLAGAFAGGLATAPGLGLAAGVSIALGADADAFSTASAMA